MTARSIFVAGCSALALAACGSQTPLDVQGDDLVAEIPAGYVATPHGYYHSSCVHQIADGVVVDHSKLEACLYPRLALSPDASAAKGTTNGWVEDVNGFSSAPATRMTSRFTVPKAPKTKSSQTDFFFPGMEPADGTIILQPVLQWGRGSPTWQVASWSCGPQCLNSSFVTVNAGDLLEGTIAGSGCSATGQCNWAITTADLTTGQSTVLNTTGDLESYTWLFNGVLEAYAVTTCSEYPSSGMINFTQVQFFALDGSLLAPTMAGQSYAPSPACAFKQAASANAAKLSY